MPQARPLRGPGSSRTPISGAARTPAMQGFGLAVTIRRASLSPRRRRTVRKEEDETRMGGHDGCAAAGLVDCATFLDAGKLARRLGKTPGGNQRACSGNKALPT